LNARQKSILVSRIAITNLLRNAYFIFYTYVPAFRGEVVTFHSILLKSLSGWKGFSNAALSFYNRSCFII